MKPMDRAGRDALVGKLAGRIVIASISGGKDSAAMALWLIENEIPHERVFCDTGWEHQTTTCAASSRP